MNFSLRFFAILFVVSALYACNDDDDKNPVTKTITIEGTAYPIVEIGTQTWTSANYAGPGGVGYDDASSRPEFGKYYLRAELASIVLPAGWRIPTQEDYKKLAQFYGITVPSQLTDTEKIASLISKTEWNNVTGTNTSGFNAYPAGYIFGESPPIDGDIAEFWTSEGVTLSIQEAGEELNKLRMTLYQSDNSPEFRFNVRFVKE